MRKFRLNSAISAIVLLLACAACSAQPDAPPGPSPTPLATGVDAATLVDAATDDDDWILPGKSYHDNRYTGLDQITKANVHELAKAWTTQIADDGEQEASPLVSHGTMYVGTPHDSVLALDATTGKLTWQHPYAPPYILDFAATRGVGIGDGKVFIATQDCRVVALDASDGKQAWNVGGCPNLSYNNTRNNWFSIASYVYNGAVILGTAGGDFGNVGHMLAFSTQDGRKLWDWQTLDPKTWPGMSWKHGGGAVWGGLAIDPATKTLFVAPGNPGPDLTDAHRHGKDLYTNSIVALDISGSQPKVKWYDQITPDDTHDADPAMGAVLFDGTVRGTQRKLLAIGDKDANFAVFDRDDGKQLFRLAVDNQTGIQSHPSKAGSDACPNHGGGIEWNGGAYDPSTNYFLIPSTEECATWKLLTDNPAWVPGQAYKGGALPKRRNATGKLTAIDVATGRIAWVHAFPYPGEGGVLVTRSGLAFTTDLGGHLYAFDTKSGRVLWQTDTGSSNVAPISAYRAGGNEYIALLSGEAGNQQTPNLPKAHGSVLAAYRLGPLTTIANSDATQTVATSSLKNSNEPASIGSAPYAPQQVTAGAQLYSQNCAACHGAQLQGISAPALTGGGLALAKLSLSQMRSIVTQQMPLGAPGSLKADQYASIIAYILSYDCVARSGTAAFPTTDRPEFKKVVFGGRSCPVKAAASGHE
jgi:alcohol dehydrogenase (cytochrome c)